MSKKAIGPEPVPKEESVRMVVIRLGTIVVNCSEELAAHLGWVNHDRDTNTTEFARQTGETEAVAALGQAVLEGLDGDRAVLRALALMREVALVRGQGQRAQLEEKAAGMRLAAERQVMRRHERRGA